VRIMGVGVDVITMSAAEYDAEVDRALECLGLTYEQLADQARRSEFSTFQAEKLWMAFGGERKP